MPRESFHIFAPAKINLFLHITGKREDGYHALQSLMAFADIGDDLEFFAQKNFEVEVKGPFAEGLGAAEDNLVYKAAQLLSEEYKIPPQGKIILTKNLPIASGIGGGSADAAAALKGLVRLWKLPDEPARLQQMALRLGADVPACLESKTVWAEGIGEMLTLVPDMPPLHFALVNPLVPVATADVFKKFHGRFSQPRLFPGPRGMTVGELKTRRNDLTEAALAAAPVIRDALAAISETDGCLLSRLSGSGATCFGLYNGVEEAQQAGEAIKAQHPEWWIATGKSL
jgi:4-diphosphocytidyl-2-C-methyl-D-erythritol kinase